MGTLRKRKVRDLYGRKHKILCPRSSYIDRDVVIDEPQAVTIGSHCQIRRGVVLRAEGGEIVIGNHCTINHYTVLHAYGGICIGDWTIIAPHCGLYAQNHIHDSFDVPIARQGSTGYGIYLAGDNWLGSHVVLCDDVTLGRGAIVGANSTVTASIPAACVAVGSPARVIRKRGRSREYGVETATTADTPSRRETLVERVLGLLHEEDGVLVVGCGDGTIVAPVAKRCASVVGCDYSRENVAKAARRFATLRFVYSNPTRLRFADGVFTVVVLLDVVQRLLERQCERALAETRRVLAPGGRLILSTPLASADDTPPSYTDLRRYDAKEMHNLLARYFERVHLRDEQDGVFVATSRSDAEMRSRNAAGGAAGTTPEQRTRGSKELQCTGC